MDEHRHTLLVVDDDADARAALEELLALHGHRVVLAADGGEALARLRSGVVPCLILLDLRMPGMNGWEFRDAQLRDPALRDVPVAVFSGDAQEEAAAAELGIRLSLRKPLDLEHLLDLIDRCGGRSDRSGSMASP